MKTQADLVKGWLLKAQSDLVACRLCVDMGRALDAACFHAQQAGEKALKAYLTAQGINFPFTHNLEKLNELCAIADSSFVALRDQALDLTPFAVELRYDSEFWPSQETADQALVDAQTIYDHVLAQLPANMQPPT